MNHNDIFLCCSYFMITKVCFGLGLVSVISLSIHSELIHLFCFFKKNVNELFATGKKNPCSKDTNFSVKSTAYSTFLFSSASRATAFTNCNVLTKHNQGIKQHYLILPKSSEIHSLSTPQHVLRSLRVPARREPSSTDGIKDVSFTETLCYFSETFFF